MMTCMRHVTCPVDLALFGNRSRNNVTLCSTQSFSTSECFEHVEQKLLVEDIVLKKQFMGEEMVYAFAALELFFFLQVLSSFLFSFRLRPIGDRGRRTLSFLSRRMPKAAAATNTCLFMTAEYLSNGSTLCTEEVKMGGHIERLTA